MREQQMMRPTVTVLPADRALLAQMADADLRPPAHQIAWLIREEARRRGLLTQENANRGAVDVEAQRAAVAA